MNVHVLQIDATPGAGHGTAGVAVVERKLNGQIIGWHSGVLPALSNNIAEYQALLFALHHTTATRLWCLSDSQLLVHHLTGACQVRHPVLRGLWHDAHDLLVQREQVVFVHIPRTLNRVADALAWEALGGRQSIAHVIRNHTGGT